MQTTIRRSLAAAGFGLSALFADASALSQEPFLGVYQPATDVLSADVVYYNRVLRMIRTDHYSKARVDAAEETIIKNRKALTNKQMTLPHALNGVLKTLDPHSYFSRVEDAINPRVQNAGWEATGMDLRIDARGASIYGMAYRSPAQQTILREGDLITAVNGNALAGLDSYAMASQMCGPERSRLRLSIERHEKPVTIDVACDFNKAHTVYTRVIEQNIGYVRLTNFGLQTYDDFHASVEAMENDKSQTITSYILDLRNNLGGWVEPAYKVGDDFIDSSKEMVRTQSRYTHDPRYAKAGDIIKGKPLIVLVNGSSFSASEMVAMILQHFKRAMVMGADTGGKGSVQTRFEIDERGLVVVKGMATHAYLTLTTGLYMSPDGTSPQQHGVIVDTQVNDTYAPKNPPQPERERENVIDNPRGQITFTERMRINSCTPDTGTQQWLSYLTSPNGAPDMTLMCAVQQLIPRAMVAKSVRTVPITGRPAAMGLRASIAQP